MRRLLVSIISMVVTASCVHAEEPCMQSNAIGYAKHNLIVVTNKPVRKLLPTFFGFNLEWLPFELGGWNRQSNQPETALIQALKPFAGAVYRYPGGLAANVFDWSEAIGTLNQRPVVKRESWLAARPIYFGLPEYLKFVQSLDGEAWYVANLQGVATQSWTLPQIAQSQADLTDYLQSLPDDRKRLLLRWELGNELDRGQYLWPPDKVAQHAKATINATRTFSNQAKFVVALQEYPALIKKGYTSKRYNQQLASALAGMVDEYAMHLYYDDKPNGLTIHQQMRAVCDAVSVLNQKNGQPPLIWITEHGFVPQGAWETPDWKAKWPETDSLLAAINVSDFVIAAAQMPFIAGQMIHALHASDGPWPMLHKDKRSGQLYSGIVLQSLTLLRQSLLPIVLQTRSFSTHLGTYNGGYDIRAVVMRDETGDKYSLWLVNRAPQTLSFTLQLPWLRHQTMAAEIHSLHHEDVHIRGMDANYPLVTSNRKTLTFDDDGQGLLVLPANSITVYQLHGLSDG